MHNFAHRKLPLSFHDMWTTNRERNPNLALRNADNLYIHAHNYATLKRLSLFSFPKIWNEDMKLKICTPPPPRIPPHPPPPPFLSVMLSYAGLDYWGLR